MLLTFRDYLRQAPHAASAYAKIKSDLITTYPESAERYQDGKSDLILRLTREAFAWKGKPVPIALLIKSDSL